MDPRGAVPLNCLWQLQLLYLREAFYVDLEGRRKIVVIATTSGAQCMRWIFIRDRLIRFLPHSSLVSVHNGGFRHCSDTQDILVPFLTSDYSPNKAARQRWRELLPPLEQDIRHG